MAKAPQKTTKPRAGDVLIETSPDTAMLHRGQQVWSCECSKWEWKKHEFGRKVIWRKECVEYGDCKLITVDLRATN